MMKSQLDYIEEEITPAHEEITALPRWESAYNPNRPIHTRHGSEDPVLVKEIFSKEPIAGFGFGRGDRSGASSPEDEKNPHHSRMMFWLVLCLVILLILAIVLGAVLGTFVNSGGNSPPMPSVTEIPAGQTPTPTPTPTSGEDASEPTPSMHIASLSITGWSIPGPLGYFTVWLFWQNSQGYLSRASFNSSTGNWTRVSNFVEARSRTPMSAVAFNTEYYKGQENYDWADTHYQANVVYLDGANRINEWTFPDDGPIFGRAGSLNEQKYMAHDDSNVASYWPRIIYQGMSGEIREARFQCYEKDECWNDDVLSTTQPNNGTHLAIVPMQTNLTSTGVFYQEEDGRYLHYTEGNNQDSAVWANDAFSNRIPLNASVVAFSATKDDSDDSRLNTYILWQDDDGVIQMSWTDDNSGWKGPITHPAFAGAENGTALTCLTGPTFAGFPLAEGNELSRCYFQTGAAVREVSFDGTSWDIVGVVPIEL